MADTNRAQFAFVREASWGVDPGSALQEILVTDGSLTQGLGTVRSATIRSDAQRSVSKRVSVDPAAKLGVEWSAGAFDELLRGGIRSDSDWSTLVNISGTDIAAVASGNKFTSTITDLSTNVAVGQWVFVAGFANAANNGWFKVSSVSTYQMVVTGGTLVNAAATPSITIKGSYIRNGSDLPSYLIQEHFQDLTTSYLVATGMRIGGFDVDISPRSIIKGSFNFMGKDLSQAAACAGNGSVTAAAGNTVMSEVDAVEEVWINGANPAWDLTTFRFAVGTAARPRSALGSLAKTGMGLNTLTVTGHIETYLDDDSWSLQGDYFDFTKFSMAVAMTDGNSKRYLVELVQCALTSEPGNTPGIDQDQMLAFDMECEPGTLASGTKTIQICRVP